MTRPVALILALILVSGCSSDEEKPNSPGVFPSTGGSGGTADAAPDTDASTGGSAGGPACVVDPMPLADDGYCVEVDGEGYQCNPVTAEPCDLAVGETCDFDGERFRCLPHAGLAGPCEACGAPGAERCVGGFTCQGLDGKCTRYCCGDEQCADGEQCVMQPPTSVGVCQATNDQIFAGFVGTVEDAGTDPVDVSPVVLDPVCEPFEPASDGSCVTVGSGGYACNPVTNEGCDEAAGEACDRVNNAEYACITGAHDQDLCAACTETGCKPGSTCLGEDVGCARYCCTDEECMPGFCDVFGLVAGPGVCVNLQD